jgi:hypothetical protein
VGTKLNKIFYDNAALGIDVCKRPDIGFIPQFQIVFVLHNPVVFCGPAFLNLWKPPFCKPIQRPFIAFSTT